MTNGWTEEIPGVGGMSTDPLNTLRRRPRLADILAAGGAGGEGERTAPEPMPGVMPPIDADEEQRLSHRIADDNQTGNRSGGPAGAYQDPGTEHLAGLRKQRAAMDAPQPKPKLWKQLLGEGLRLAPTIAAYASGGMGATEGAEAGYEQGVRRRQQQTDLAGQRREAEKQRLSQEIEQEARAGEQRTFQHGEDVLRQETAERGLAERERVAQTAETARSQRLAETIKAQGERQQAGFEQQDELEDRKQVNRMELQHAKAEAQAAIQRYKTAHPTEQKIPPVLAKTFSTYQQSQSRMDVMEKSYEDAMRDPGNQQAMLNLLANHLGMTMGLQPGARMNQAIIREAERSGYLTERIEAHFVNDPITGEEYAAGVVLTPRQMRQMIDLARSRLMEDARAVKDTEAYFGVQGHAPISPRSPAKAGGGAGGGAGGPGAPNAPSSAPKTADEYLKKRKAASAGTSGTATIQ